MCRGISRNIPAAQRSLILDRISQINKWPGERRIGAVMTKGQIRLSYDGQGGYVCLRIDPDDNFDDRLVTLDGMIEQDIAVTRIEASLKQISDVVDRWTKNDGWDTPLWSWTVPVEMRIAYQQDNPAGIREWIKKQTAALSLNLSYNPASTKFGDTVARIRGDAWGLTRYQSAKIELFSVKTDQSHVSWNTNGHYLKVDVEMPKSALMNLEGKPVNTLVSHPLIDPQTIIKSAKADGPSVIFNMWRQASILEPAPLQSIDDVKQAFQHYRSDQWPR